MIFVEWRRISDERPLLYIRNIFFFSFYIYRCDDVCCSHLQSQQPQYSQTPTPHCEYFGFLFVFTDWLMTVHCSHIVIWFISWPFMVCTSNFQFPIGIQGITFLFLFYSSSSLDSHDKMSHKLYYHEWINVNLMQTAKQHEQAYKYRSFHSELTRNHWWEFHGLFCPHIKKSTCLYIYIYTTSHSTRMITDHILVLY